MKWHGAMAPAGYQLPRFSLNPSQVVLASFIAFILAGAILLSLPIAHAGAPHHWIDDLFMAASAVCVTGLATLDPGTTYSLFGQLVILLLIQVGGFGYMTLFTVSMLMVGRRLSMRDRLALQEAADQPGMMGLMTFFKNIVVFTLTVEGLGFLLLATSTIPELGWGRGVYIALFHAISAFNNAGFSLFSEGVAHWQLHAWPLLVISGLVIIGGLGYNVNQELVRRYVWRRNEPTRWNTLIVIVLTMTAVLLVGGTLLFWLFERNNPETLGLMPWHTQWSNAFFMAVQPRTAGFNSIDVGAMDRPTLMLFMVLMFIGAGPGGTAGGIKLTTAAVILAGVYSALRGQSDINLVGLRRRVSEPVVRKATAVFVLSLSTVVVALVVIASIEPFPFLPLMFEVTSAFGTVGLSMGITAQLSDASKLILVATMLTGRVGVLAVMLSIFTHRERSRIRFAEEPLLVG